MTGVEASGAGLDDAAASLGVSVLLSDSVKLFRTQILVSFFEKPRITNIVAK